MIVRPEDVVRAAEYVRSVLEPAVGADWSVPAGRLEWDVTFTVTHMAAAPAKYALYLASRSTRYVAVRTDGYPDATQTERLDAIVGAAHALANVAAMTPPEVRAFHAVGMFDAEGYVAMGCSEILIHGHDCAIGLGLRFDPPDDLVRGLVGRLYPWLAGDDEPAWSALLWHVGRIDLPGRESHDDDTWTLLRGSLDEWNGEIPVGDPRTVVEWVRDEGSWCPVYRED